MIAAVITGARSAGNDSTPPSISSRLPKVGSRSAFLFSNNAAVLQLVPSYFAASDSRQSRRMPRLEYGKAAGGEPGLVKLT